MVKVAPCASAAQVGAGGAGRAARGRKPIGVATRTTHARAAEAGRNPFLLQRDAAFQHLIHAALFGFSIHVVVELVVYLLIGFFRKQ